MNIFGSFTFGSLIKTFLPGVVWLFAIGLIESDIAQYRGGQSLWTQFISNTTQAASVLTIGFLAAILFGMLSNVIVFMGINDRWVRNPVRKRNPDLFSLYEHLSSCIRNKSWPQACLQAADRNKFDQHTDVEIIMLASIDQDKLAYVREQYWYHLEFQMNLVLSLVALFVGVVFNILFGSSAAASKLNWVIVYVAIFVPTCACLVTAARKNYARHVSKMLSLMAGVLSSEPKSK